MPSLTLDDNQAHYQIRAFKSGQIQVNDKTLTTSLIITAHHLIENWPPVQVSEISYETLVPAITLNPKILIIGTGNQQHFISLDIYGHLLNQGIGVEIMHTAAACRTYNVLTSENRNVVAALILK